jgi:Outer membrane protein beta-barrel domain
MKKVSLFLAVSMLFVAHFAQAQSRVGVTLNMNVSRYRIPDASTSSKGKANIGFNAGITGDVELMPVHFYLQPQLLFSMKSFKTPSGKSKYNFTMVEIPISAVYKYPIKKIGKVYAGIGPNFGIYLGGRYKSGSRSEKLKFGSTDDVDFKRLDIGLNFLTGFELNNKLFFNIRHTLGLSNIEPNANNSIIKTANWQFGLGYYF